MKYEELYRFICSMIRPPCTSTVFEFLYSFKPFFVDIKNNIAKELKYEPEKKLREPIVYKKIEKKAREARVDKKDFLVMLGDRIKDLSDKFIIQDNSKSEEEKG